MTDQIFAVLSIFFVVEILSQLFKFEVLGKIFVQFYVLLMHFFVITVLVTYESRELVFYFVSLVAFVNALRFIFYKLPSLSENGKQRFFFDVSIVAILSFLLFQVSAFIELDAVEALLPAVYQWPFLISLGLILFYEMFQRANEVGLDIRSYLPDTFFSFIIVTAMSLLFIGLSVGLFIFEANDALMIIQYTPFLIGGVIVFMFLITFSDQDRIERFSILYVLPTLFIFVQFFSIFLT